MACAAFGSLSTIFTCELYALEIRGCTLLRDSFGSMWSIETIWERGITFPLFAAYLLAPIDELPADMFAVSSTSTATFTPLVRLVFRLNTELPLLCVFFECANRFLAPAVERYNLL